MHETPVLKLDASRAKIQIDTICALTYFDFHKHKGFESYVASGGESGGGDLPMHALGLAALPKNAVSRASDVRAVHCEVGPELYRLADDPCCQKNVVNHYPQTAKLLRSAYVEFLNRQGTPASRLQYYRPI